MEFEMPQFLIDFVNYHAEIMSGHDIESAAFGMGYSKSEIDAVVLAYIMGDI